MVHTRGSDVMVPESVGLPVGLDGADRPVATTHATGESGSPVVGPPR